MNDTGPIVDPALRAAEVLAPSGMSYHDACQEFRKALVRLALVRAGNSRTAAARALGLQRTYIYRLIHTLGVAAEFPSPRRRP